MPRKISVAQKVNKMLDRYDELANPEAEPISIKNEKTLNKIINKVVKQVKAKPIDTRKLLRLNTETRQSSN